MNEHAQSTPPAPPRNNYRIGLVGLWRNTPCGLRAPFENVCRNEETQTPRIGLQNRRTRARDRLNICVSDVQVKCFAPPPLSVRSSIPAHTPALRCVRIFSKTKGHLLNTSFGAHFTLKQTTTHSVAPSCLFRFGQFVWVASRKGD